MAAPWDKDSLIQALKQDPEFGSKCPSLAAGILSRQIDLVKLVENLKDLLTNPEPSQRSRGIFILSSVLSELPPDFLQEDEVRFIAIFFCDRLKDHHDVIPSALSGILAILHMSGLAKDLPSQILNTLMMNINCQSQRQEDRLNIYRILDALIIPHIDGLKTIGPDVVYHILSAIDGERDPRNLKLIFSMLPSMLKCLPLGHLTEDFFEVVACYFPVDFKPAAGDSNHVTREDLALTLADCLTAVPSFAEFCLPLLLEKLDSSLRIAKLDSLFLLKRCCQVFKAEDILVHLTPIWMSLSRETLSTSDSEVRFSALEAVTYLLRCLADVPSACSSQSNPLKQLLSDIIAAAASALSEVQTSLFMPATDLILAAAMSCNVACESIIMKVIPLLLESFHVKQESADKYLQTITRLLNICISLQVVPENVPSIGILWNSVVRSYLNAAEHKESLVRKEALAGLTTVIPTLDLTECSQLFSVLMLSVDREDDKEVRMQCRFCLHQLSNLREEDVRNSVLYERLKQLDIPCNDPRFERRLVALCVLAEFKQFSNDILPNLVNLVVHSHNVHQIHISLSAIRTLLESAQGECIHLYNCLHGQCDAVFNLIDWWISSVRNTDTNSWVYNEDVLKEICLVLGAVTRNLNSQDQTTLVCRTIGIFHPGCDTFRPLDPSSSQLHLMAVNLMEAVVGSLHSNVSVPDVHELCRILAKLAISCPYSSTRVSAGRLCASLVNKVADVKLLEDILTDMTLLLESALSQNLEQDAAQAASLYGWIVKGLAMRGFRNLEDWIDKLVNILADNRRLIALSAAEAFKVIVEESPYLLNQQSHCISRLLYRQRVFASALKLVQKSRIVPIGDRIAFLLALAHLLNGVPQSVLALNLGEVLPLLLESLSQASPVLLEAALNTLKSLLVEPVYHTTLGNQVQTMLPRLLCLLTLDHSMKIRMNALRSLYEVCQLPLDLILPFKAEVVLKLEQSLDDPKRLVRKEAVKARTRWLLLAAPGNNR